MAQLFHFGLSPLEIIVRGTLVYWFIFLLFRLVLRRDAGSIGIADVLFVVLIADASQNGMAGEYRTVSEGFVLIATIAGWNLLIDWMAYRYSWFSKLMEPQPLPLVRYGRILHANMRATMLTREELESQLREQGVENIKDVKSATLEPDGKISVIRARESS